MPSFLKDHVVLESRKEGEAISYSSKDYKKTEEGKYKNDKKKFSLSESSNLNEAASNLYKTFRKIKKKGYKKIQIAKIPLKGPGIAINDRIKRAAI